MVDRYLDGLLAARGDGSARGHARGHDPEPLDPSLREAAHVLRRSLVRVHPSFQFEERLSARLSAMAAQAGPHPRLGAVIAFPQRPPRVDAARCGTRPTTATWRLPRSRRPRVVERPPSGRS